jgi:hypothetical protein
MLHDLLIASVFVAMLIAPALVTMHSEGEETE